MTKYVSCNGYFGEIWFYRCLTQPRFGFQNYFMCYNLSHEPLVHDGNEIGLYEGTIQHQTIFVVVKCSYKEKILKCAK